MPIPKSWVMRLPTGLREQPGWIFIGSFITLVGITYLTGLTSSRMADLIGPWGVRVWGGFLTTTGVLVVVATWRAKPALEKMALRWLAFSMFAYAGCVITIVGISQAAMTVVLAGILIVLAEIRVGYIKVLLSRCQHKGTGEKEE